MLGFSIRLASREAPVAALVSAILLGCSSITAPEREPDFSGVIVELGLHLGSHHASDSLLLTKVWVKALEEECGVTASVRKNTTLLLGDKRGEASNLVPGEVAEVWIKGPIEESCPAQGMAGTIKVKAH